MKITLERSHFKTNSAGDNEFEWYLRELRIPEDQWSEIDSVEIDAEVLQINKS